MEKQLKNLFQSVKFKSENKFKSELLSVIKTTDNSKKRPFFSLILNWKFGLGVMVLSLILNTIMLTNPTIAYDINRVVCESTSICRQLTLDTGKYEYQLGFWQSNDGGVSIGYGDSYYEFNDLDEIVRDSGGKLINRLESEAEYILQSGGHLKTKYGQDPEVGKSGWYVAYEHTQGLSDYEMELLNTKIHADNPFYDSNLIEYEHPSLFWYMRVFLDVYFNNDPVVKNEEYSIYRLPGGREYKFVFSENKITIYNNNDELITTIDLRANYTNIKICNKQCSRDDYSQENTELPLQTIQRIVKEYQPVLEKGSTKVYLFDGVLYSISFRAFGKYEVRSQRDTFDAFSLLENNIPSYEF